MDRASRGGRRRIGYVLACLGCVAAARAGSADGDRPSTAPAQPGKKPSLQKALADLKVPPDWFADVAISWNTGKPWKDARLEVRRLLALGTQEGFRQAVKLTCLYRDKKDIGDGHEYPMYLFLAGQTAWATRAYEEFLAGKHEGNTHAFLDLTSCYAHFGEYAKAQETLQQAMRNLPPAPWRVARQADVHNALGDLYAQMNDKPNARLHYTKAIALYPTSDQPYGRHVLAKHAAKVQAKLDMLDMDRLQQGKLRDGTYSGVSLGYNGPLTATVTVRDGRIAEVRVQHDEKIHLNAVRIIPEKIVEAQSLRVDAITGATVTSQAIVDAGFQALKKARRP